ncbi:lipoate--protein ligase family protein [Candidatus Woesearchaeota archaeon]|nr:lipoate--protein ligase family protein [Candidatus Woesearchaeota archaeon]
MMWRVIEEESYNAAMNMAIDHAICESVANEREPPTIRFYRWLKNSVSIGAYQNYEDVDLDACKQHNVEIVRRITGGRAVFHDKRDFTYSVIAHIRTFDYNIESAYKAICQCIINALAKIGINASLESKNDIIINGKKISGNASKLLDKGVYLQHGTLIYDINEVMPIVLRLSPDLVKQRVASVLEYEDLSQQKVYEILKESFLIGKKYTLEKLSEFELMRAKDLANTKYNTLILPNGSFVKNKGACYIERSG